MTNASCDNSPMGAAAAHVKESHHFRPSDLFSPANGVVAPSADKFISWVSVMLLIVFLLLSRSIAAPFLNPLGEARLSAGSSFYFNLTVFVYIWLVSATALTVMPHFSSHYNEIIAAALFFPMLFATIAALMVGRFVVRLLYFAAVNIRIITDARKAAIYSKNRGGGKNEDIPPTSPDSLICSNVVEKKILAAADILTASSIMPSNQSQINDNNGISETILEEEISDIFSSTNNAHNIAGATLITPEEPMNKAKTTKPPVMIAFHRPFRQLVKSSAFLSGALCLLYAHCWSRSLSAFKLSKDHGAGAVCRAAFFPVAFGTFVKEGNGANIGASADESCIWLLWGASLLVMLSFYVQDEFAGDHCTDGACVFPTKGGVGRLNRSLSTRSSFGILDLERSFVDESADRDEFVSDDVSEKQFVQVAKSAILQWTYEKPQDTLPMVPWYSILLVLSVFDILVQLKVFLGRFDARTMQPALQTGASLKPRTTTTSCNGTQPCYDEEFKDLQLRYPGCVFEYETRDAVSNGEFWFDYMADCGDGFSSSYHVARMLAQPRLSVRSSDVEKDLPRGEFLVIGGDLAYPDPTKESYEKRFFRTFEDAMPPPPSFQRDNISTHKPALPVKEWKDCFKRKANGEELLRAYRGPCAFAIPGNHDWFDGLATFSRFILARDWLGGWLMPQQRSYFSIKLPEGWWIFAMDLALSADIDIDQYKFFADIADRAMKPTDAVILISHEPHWVLDADMNKPVDELAERNIRELMNTHLAGKVRVRLAGDLHHYTRHVPVANKSGRLKHSKSLSVEQSTGANNSKKATEPDLTFEENKPELIVSGGGGAFLHGTHTFSKNIKVGEKQSEYVRVCAYPDEKISHRLGWLNIWHFRWRNWRLDVVWAVAYFGIVLSLFPLCGIYADFHQYNPSHHPGLLVIWVTSKVYSLFVEIIVSSKVSLVCSLVVILSLYLLTDEKLKPTVRLFWGVSHGLAHVAAALTCLLFVQCMTEWVVEDGIVNVIKGSDSGIAAPKAFDLASSLYNEYTTHFSHVFANLTDINTTSLGHFQREGEKVTSFFAEFEGHAYETVLSGWKWLYNEVPLLKGILAVFDLPGMIADKHYKICSVLCTENEDCLVRNDPARYQLISRLTFAPYLAATFLYFVVMAIPFAGALFGTWLALTLNVFKAQYNEGFSSLRIQHWKNFLKICINEKGDLEIFSIGLHRVPKYWMKDPRWDGDSCVRRLRAASTKGFVRNGRDRSLDDTPSWVWKRPSKWIPVRNSKKFVPEVIDFTCIQKRSSTFCLPRKTTSLSDLPSNESL